MTTLHRTCPVCGRMASSFEIAKNMATHIESRSWKGRKTITDIHMECYKKLCSKGGSKCYGQYCS